MLGNLLKPELEELIREKRWDVLRESLSQFHPAEIAEILVEVPNADDVALFRILPREFAGQVFAHLPHDHQDVLVRSLTNDQMRTLLAEMSPDDQARVLEELPAAVTRRLLASLGADELHAARDLLGYPPNTAGRLMTPEYVAIPSFLTAGEALEQIRRTGRDKETVNIVYVVDEHGKLIEDLELGTLVMADPIRTVGEIYDGPVISLKATTRTGDVLRAFEKYDRVALPVTDSDGHMLGIITVDDVLHAARRYSTRQMQKIGGMEALDAPYLDVSFGQMLVKRGGWLSILFLGEMLTASAMGYFEAEIQSAVVLALFVPLIISSGGNSGSQAATLIVRSLGLRELRLRDWFIVFGRELRTSLTLGAWLGFIGFLRIVVFHKLGLITYGEHYLLIGLTVWLSLIGVVTFGSVTGSMLPFLLRRLGFDPATSSAPFVATLVDVTGLIIYFTVAMLILRGTLL